MAPDLVLRCEVVSIGRWLDRVRHLVGGQPERLADQTIEDAVVLNLQRACEAAIAAAMRVVAQRRLGLPQDSREAFTLLERAALLEPNVADRMRKMVGFRNVAVHAYQELDKAIVTDIASNRLGDFEALAAAVMRIEPAPEG